MSDERILGPNAKSLLSRFIARRSIPDGGGLADGLKFFTDADHRRAVIAGAFADMDAAIAVVKATPDNPYGDDEEAIAAVIMKLVEAREQSRLHP